MGTYESSIYTGKSVEKDLVLEFEEGDDVLAGIRTAIQQHGIRECNAVQADGQLNHATIQYFNKSKFTSTELLNGRIISCSGRFMNLKEGIYGDLHVGFMLGMQMWDGTLTRAIAKKGFQLTLRFHQPVTTPQAPLKVDF